MPYPIAPPPPAPTWTRAALPPPPPPPPQYSTAIGRVPPYGRFPNAILRGPLAPPPPPPPLPPAPSPAGRPSPGAPGSGRIMAGAELLGLLAEAVNQLAGQQVVQAPSGIREVSARRVTAEELFLHGLDPPFVGLIGPIVPTPAAPEPATPQATEVGGLRVHLGDCSEVL